DLHQVRPPGPDRKPALELERAAARDLVLQPAFPSLRVRGPGRLRPLRADRTQLRMTRSSSHAVVTLAALDLRRRPDHRSELRSQLLLGEVVRVLERSRDRQWWRVRNQSDGYAGWVRTWGLVPCSRARAQRWIERARGRMVRAYAEITSGRGSG